MPQNSPNFPKKHIFLHILILFSLATLSISQKVINSYKYIPQQDNEFYQFPVPWVRDNHEESRKSLQIEVLLDIFEINRVHQKPVLIVSKQQFQLNPKDFSKLIEENLNPNYQFSRLDIFTKEAFQFSIDRQGYMNRGTTHFISMPYPMILQEGQTENIYIQVRDLNSPDASLLNAEITIYEGQNKFECYNWCNIARNFGQCKPYEGYWMEKAFNVERECSCKSNRLGPDCSIAYQNINIGSLYEFQKRGQIWQSFKTEMKQEVDYKIQLSHLAKNSYVSLILMNEQSYVQYPNFEFNSFFVSEDSFLYEGFTKDSLSAYFNSMETLGKKPTIIISVFSPQGNYRQTQLQHTRIQISAQKQQEDYFPPTVIVGIVLVSLIVCICLCNCIVKLRAHRQNMQNNGNNENANENIVELANGNNPNQQNIRIKKVYVIITQTTIDKYMPDTTYKCLTSNISILKEDSQECTVCLCEFEPDERVRLTVCFHIFHRECIDSWIKKHGTCPCCRHKLTRKTFEDQDGLSREFSKNDYRQKIMKFIKQTKFDIDELPEHIEEKEQQKLEDEKKKEQTAIVISENKATPNKFLKIIEDLEQSVNPLKYMKEFDFIFKSEKALPIEQAPDDLNSDNKDKDDPAQIFPIANNEEDIQNAINDENNNNNQNNNNNTISERGSATVAQQKRKRGNQSSRVFQDPDFFIELPVQNSPNTLAQANAITNISNNNSNVFQIHTDLEENSSINNVHQSSLMTRNRANSDQILLTNQSQNTTTNRTREISNASMLMMNSSGGALNVNNQAHSPMSSEGEKEIFISNGNSPQLNSAQKKANRGNLSHFHFINSNAMKYSDDEEQEEERKEQKRRKSSNNRNALNIPEIKENDDENQEYKSNKVIDIDQLSQKLENQNNNNNEQNLDTIKQTRIEKFKMEQKPNEEDSSTYSPCTGGKKQFFNTEYGSPFPLKKGDSGGNSPENDLNTESQENNINLQMGDDEDFQLDDQD